MNVVAQVRFNRIDHRLFNTAAISNDGTDDTTLIALEVHDLE